MLPSEKWANELADYLRENKLVRPPVAVIGGRSDDEDFKEVETMVKNPPWVRVESAERFLKGDKGALWHAFTWSDTSEGHDWWCRVAEGAAPELLRRAHQRVQEMLDDPCVDKK
jgi:hypothetical protein